jgi:hypothetical protein
LVVAEYVSKERKGKSLVANAAVAVQIHADPGLDGAEHLVSGATLTVLLLVRGEGRSLAAYGLLHPMRLTTNAAVAIQVHADPGFDGTEYLASDAALTVLLLVRGEGRSLATHGLLRPMRLTTDAAIMVEVVARAFLGGVHDGLLDEVRHGCDGVF